MVTILNTHHEYWLDTGGNDTEFDSKLPRLEAIWTQIAAKFEGANETLVFEVPHDSRACIPVTSSVSLRLTLRPRLNHPSLRCICTR